MIFLMIKQIIPMIHYFSIILVMVCQAMTETFTSRLPLQILINHTGEDFSFEELRMRMRNTIPTRVVVILDCCYSGSAKISKGSEDDAAKIGRLILEEKSRKLP